MHFPFVMELSKSPAFKFHIYFSDHKQERHNYLDHSIPGEEVSVFIRCAVKIQAQNLPFFAMCNKIFDTRHKHACV